jgi:outer membrane lipoprotein carrier protein
MTRRKSTARILMPLLIAAFCILTPAGFLQTTRAAVETPAEIAARLQAKYNQIKSLTFDFIQHTTGQLTGRGGSGRGRAYFLKTGKKAKMLWDYISPNKQIILSDGTTLSMYYPGRFSSAGYHLFVFLRNRKFARRFSYPSSRS